eukprot:CAMPEP_0183375002 /NCGR_PEP_ID=MMETSP0164_2-20130417/116072_1 /TAXON_ID=221442 /ORGANISM="Coccolithus pelagicus ssp braarudi, Strain PLY182g" /LENGTH=114 /DNA_ID=CAMNT_0025552101 /DNA_START=289 /DNA_END=634 /DNA_ORIENTATION=-
MTTQLGPLVSTLEHAANPLGSLEREHALSRVLASSLFRSQMDGEAHVEHLGLEGGTIETISNTAGLSITSDTKRPQHGQPSRRKSRLGRAIRERAYDVRRLAAAGNSSNSTASD